MSTLSANSFSHSVYLGQKEPGLPVIGVGATGSWCEAVTTDKSRRETSVLTSWTPDLKAFQNTLCADALRNPKDVTQHFDTVTFTRNGDSHNTLPFGFYVDNTCDQRNEHSLLYIYSTQDKKMVFKGFATPPGSFNNLVRYDTEDRAFCLRKNTTPDLYPAHDSDVAPSDAFKIVCNSDVCGFIILVTQAKDSSKRDDRLYVQTDGVTQAKDSKRDDSLYVRTDSVDGFATSKQGAKPHHANLLKGASTNTKFSRVDLEYKDAPIHIYNVTILLEDLV